MISIKKQNVALTGFSHRKVDDFFSTENVNKKNLIPSLVNGVRRMGFSMEWLMRKKIEVKALSKKNVAKKMKSFVF